MPASLATQGNDVVKVLQARVVVSDLKTVTLNVMANQLGPLRVVLIIVVIPPLPCRSRVPIVHVVPFKIIGENQWIFTPMLSRQGVPFCIAPDRIGL